MEHDFGYATGGVELRGRVTDWAVGEDVDDAGNLVVDALPVVDIHTVSAGGVGDGGCVEEEIGGTAAGCVDDHCVFECGVGEDVAGLDASFFGHYQRAGGSYGDIEPCGCAAWRERAVCDSKAEGFGDDLGRAGGA